jgi:CDGSH-type Zn-finger protein
MILSYIANLGRMEFSEGTAQRAQPVVSADGFEYEVRNRVTLCRCGQSQNKPFCDGTHAQTKFKDT